MARIDTSSSVHTGTYDVAVIGAGINGLAIAREAATRGLTVAVIERDDLGARTSSISTRLIHGGLKYLERLDFRLVVESVRERTILLRQAPHLVHPYPMLIPFYRGNSRPGWLIASGLVLHDLLALGKPLPMNRVVGRRRLKRQWPTIEHRGLGWGGLFADAQVPWTERLVVELALSASDHGARILTHCEVTQIDSDGGAARGLRYRDTIDGTEHSLRARTVVNAAGPWVDAVLGQADSSEPLIGPTKGSHVVVDPFPGAPPTCVFFEARADARPMFVLPWAGRYMIGTTDLPFDGDLEDITASDDEVDYLLTEANRLLPGADLRPEDVLWSYSGVRPLPFVADNDDPGKVTRDHEILSDTGLRNLFSVIGGKLTTHRALSEEAVDLLVARLGKGRRRTSTRRAPLPGAPRTRSAARFVERYVARSALDPLTARRLASIYGERAGLLEDLILRTPELAEVIDPDSGAVAAEVVFAVRQEGARTLEDILLRRCLVGLNGDVGLTAAPRAVDVAARHLGWDAERCERELTAYRAAVRRFRPRALQRAGSVVGGEAR